MLVDEDALRLAFAQRQLVTANRHLDRVSKRRHLAHVHPNAFRDAHVHDVALKRAFSAQAAHRSGFADLHIAQRFALNIGNLALTSISYALSMLV